MMLVTSTSALDGAERGPGRVAVVMTMGALHDGHAELMRSARRVVGDDGTVIATIFVNPTQFGVGEDFDRYPRTLDDDLVVCEGAGVDVVLSPTVLEVYGDANGFRPDAITIDPGPLGDILEGASRRGHFRGMLTVVHKLMGMTDPDVALFGEKDYQQLQVIKALTRDLELGVEIVGMPTIRETDGLAMSSRNTYLSPEDRQRALSLSKGLFAMQAAAKAGEVNVSTLLALGTKSLTDAQVKLDYLEVRDVETLEPLTSLTKDRPARALVAAFLGTTRLIDNVALTGP